MLTKNSNLTTLQLGKCGIAQVSQRLTVFLIELIEDSCTSIQGLPTLLAEGETVHEDCIALLQASLHELAIETANIAENILYCFCVAFLFHPHGKIKHRAERLAELLVSLYSLLCLIDLETMI